MSEVSKPHKEPDYGGTAADRKRDTMSSHIGFCPHEHKCLELLQAEGRVADLVEQLEATQKALREITATDWHSEGWSKETPFQFEQRIHKIAADALMGVVSNPAKEPS